MKKIFLILGIVAFLSFHACSEADFSDNYSDPSKISTATVDKMYSGFLYTNREYVLPAYTNYFVVLRTTLTRYTQAVGWINAPNQYVPGEAGIGSRWGNFYSFLAHYRELEKVYNALPQIDQDNLRVFMLTATIYLYDHTQRVVDLHGDIPFLEAGRLSQNGGDYINSLAGYDTAQEIYTTMLDGLKGFSDELNTINVSAGTQVSFETQDFVNNGDLNLWKKYCNSLRLRMLTRVSGVSEFQARSQSEIAVILGNPTQYPVVDINSDNIQMDVISLDTDINSKGFRDGLESWDGNLAGKKMIDHMLNNSDPRLRAMFEPGEESAGVYLGLDPLLTESTQTGLFNSGVLSIYNRTTMSRNEFFPGILMTASEVNLLKAEYYLNINNDALAKSNYEDAIRKSIEFYYDLNALSADDTVGPLTPTNPTEVEAYVNSSEVNWANALTTQDKLSLIATEKWIHFGIVQLPDSWAEQRRLDLPEFEFRVDNANTQKTPPNRWIYPSDEKVYNNENYSTVSSKDNLTTKLFWDVN